MTEIPQTPQNTGFCNPQHGYADIEIKTINYSGNPTPFPREQGKINDFILSHTDSAHQKKYAKSLFSFLVKTLCK